MATHGPLRATPAVADVARDVPVILIVAASALANRLAAVLGNDYAVGDATDVRRAAQSAAALHPDLILIDAAAMASSGGATTMELREQPNVGDTPVVIFSADASDEARLTLTPADEHRPASKAWRLDELPAWVAGALAERSRARKRVASQTAASIAHELNQPLNAIASYCETALRLVRAGNPKPDRLLHALERSSDQAQRAARVARELIEFLYRGESLPEAVNLNDAVMRALAIVESIGFGGFRAVVDLAPNLKPVRANRLHVEKVLANLLRNGVEAMRGAGVRMQAITIRTAADDRDAQVTVSDTGPGLDAETARRVFEPFFTTKEAGIGMGLAISRALVEAHGGKLWVDLDGALGAAFHVTLPFAE